MTHNLYLYMQYLTALNMINMFNNKHHSQVTFTIIIILATN